MGWQRVAPITRLRHRPVSTSRTKPRSRNRCRREGRRATLRNALSDVASFGLSRGEAIPIVRSMQETVKADWEDLFKTTGFTVAEMERIRTCFIACDEPIRDDNGEAL